MTTFAKRLGLGIGAVVLAGLGTLAYVTAQDQNTSGPGRPFMGRRGPGPGGRWFQGGGPLGPIGPMDRLGGPMLRGLDLTDAQQADVRKLIEAHRTATGPVADRLAAARQALRASVTASALDEAAIRKHSAEVAAAEADIAVALARLHADVSKILTPEQRTRLEQNRAAMADRVQAMRGRRQGPPPGPPL
jgi:Spy/CpxP family protein refolding chaperone